MVSFIDDIIIGIEAEKEYDKLVEKVMKRLAENNLYVKPEKYKWKIKEVEFLGVVIESKEIKIEVKKMKSVLN